MSSYDPNAPSIVSCPICLSVDTYCNGYQSAANDACLYYCSDYGHPWYAKCLIWNGETRGTLYRNEYDEDGEFDDDDEEEDDYYDDEEDDEYEEDEYDDDEEW